MRSLIDLSKSRESLSEVLAGVAAVTLLSACASTATSYQPPPAGTPAAELIGHGIAATGLPFRDTVGHVSFVDGKPTSSLAATVRIASGTRRVGIDCFVRRKTNVPPYFFSWEVQQVVVTGDLLAGHEYYAKCESTDGTLARIWLADSPDGQSLPQRFTSVCTRSCTAASQAP